MLRITRHSGRKGNSLTPDHFWFSSYGNRKEQNEKKAETAIFLEVYGYDTVV